MGVRRGYALSAAVLAFVTAGVVSVGVLLQPPAEDAGAARVQVPPPAATTSQPPVEPDVEPAVGTHVDRSKERVFDKAAHSTTEATSPWVVVNKKHPIGTPDFRPELRIVRGYQVAEPAAGPLGRLLADADRKAFGFKIASAFRSYGYQQTVYGNVVSSWGQERADQLSARPGFSEHQTGLAIDLVTPASPGCDFEACFATTPAGRWLHANAWRYGFVVRYLAGSEAVTGYAPEPWHLRYVGRPLAAELRRTHTPTLEEFFGVTGGDYR